MFICFFGTIAQATNKSVLVAQAEDSDQETATLICRQTQGSLDPSAHWCQRLIHGETTSIFSPLHTAREECCIIAAYIVPKLIETIYVHYLAHNQK